MTYNKRKYSVKKDLKQFGYDFLRIYPRTLSWVINNWKFTLVFIVVIWSAFYLDPSVRIYMQGFRNSFLDPIMTFGWWYGNGSPTLYLFLIFYIVGISIANEKLRTIGALVFESYVFAGLITLIFKSFFGRSRPYTNLGELDFSWLIIGSNDVYSFSSGHASVAFALSTVLASSTKNIYLKILFFLFATITSLSRMYHDQHWLSDVTMGSFLGILISTLIIRLHKEEKTEVEEISTVLPESNESEIETN